MQGLHRWLLGAVALIISFAFVPATAGAAEQACPGTFSVLHNDHIGKLELRKGKYTITVSDNTALTCQRASKLFTRFLEDFDGRLPGQWVVRANKAAFLKGKSDVSFSVARDGGGSGGGGGGGGKHPANGGKRCPNTFQVMNNDRIGDLRIPQGPYHLTRLTSDSPSCERVVKLFAKFLQEDWAGKIPGWRMNVQKAQFVRNKSGGKGFRIKPAR